MSERLLVASVRVSAMLAPHLGDGIELLCPPNGTRLIDWHEFDGKGVRVAALLGNEPFPEALFARLPDLRHLVAIGQGTDGIDLDAAARRGVSVSNAGGIHAPEIANYAIGLMIAARRRILEGDRLVRSGDWVTTLPKRSRSIVGARVGIVGLGHIGAALAARAEALGCRVGWHGPRDKPDVRWPRAASLLQLAEESDILLVAVRADDETRGLIDRPVLDALGPDGLLVNVSRGFVVDEPALIAALSDRRLGQAALDVFDPEPTDPARWADVPNLLLSPHQSGSAVEIADLLGSHAAQRITNSLTL